jgi:hypothetical protein
MKSTNCPYQALDTVRIEFELNIIITPSASIVRLRTVLKVLLARLVSESAISLTTIFLTISYRIGTVCVVSKVSSAIISDFQTSKQNKIGAVVTGALPDHW